MAELEFRIIEEFFRDASLSFDSPGLDLGIGDDCALLSLGAGEQLAISMDLLQPGIHFPSHALPGLIARRALAVNLSDLAAAGAEPLCFTLGLALPQADHTWLEAFSQGLAVVAGRYRCPLAGGDLIRGNLQIVIQVHGRVPAGQALLRSGARPGDQIYVTGTLGDGAAGLALILAYEQGGDITRTDPRIATNRLSVTDRDCLINAFYAPDPRIEAGIALRGLASAAIDLSDGLHSDLAHVTHASGVGAVIDLPSLPCSPAMTACIREECRQAMALVGGDDYELCVAVPTERSSAAEEAMADLGLAFTRIGEAVETPGVRYLDAEGDTVDIQAGGFSHFGREEA